MPFSQADIEYYAQFGNLRESFSVAKAAGKQTVFLSHSHKDATLAKGLQGFLRAQGWQVYIDWEDGAMPDTPNRTTAERIQAKIRDADWFLYLATANSSSSKWCPWEIGYADGKKSLTKIGIVQTRDGQGYTYGSEYLELYRRLDFAEGGGLGAFNSDGRGFKLSA